MITKKTLLEGAEGIGRRGWSCCLCGAGSGGSCCSIAHLGRGSPTPRSTAGGWPVAHGAAPPICSCPHCPLRGKQPRCFYPEQVFAGRAQQDHKRSWEGDRQTAYNGLGPDNPEAQQLKTEQAGLPKFTALSAKSSVPPTWQGQRYPDTEKGRTASEYPSGFVPQGCAKGSNSVSLQGATWATPCPDSLQEQQREILPLVTNLSETGVDTRA